MLLLDLPEKNEYLKLCLNYLICIYSIVFIYSCNKNMNQQKKLGERRLFFIHSLLYITYN